METESVEMTLVQVLHRVYKNSGRDTTLFSQTDVIKYFHEIRNTELGSEIPSLQEILYYINYLIKEFNFTFSLDNNGYPLIPRNGKVTRVVISYLIERFDYKLWRAGKLSFAIYSKSEQEYLMSINSR